MRILERTIWFGKVQLDFIATIPELELGNKFIMNHSMILA